MYVCINLTVFHFGLFIGNLNCFSISQKLTLLNFCSTPVFFMQTPTFSFRTISLDRDPDDVKLGCFVGRLGSCGCGRWKYGQGRARGFSGQNFWVGQFFETVWTVIHRSSLCSFWTTFVRTRTVCWFGPKATKIWFKKLSKIANKV